MHYKKIILILLLPVCIINIFGQEASEYKDELLKLIVSKYFPTESIDQLTHIILPLEKKYNVLFLENVFLVGTNGYDHNRIMYFWYKDFNFVPIYIENTLETYFDYENYNKIILGEDLVIDIDNAIQYISDIENIFFHRSIVFSEEDILDEIKDVEIYNDSFLNEQIANYMNRIIQPKVNYALRKIKLKYNSYLVDYPFLVFYNEISIDESGKICDMKKTIMYQSNRFPDPNYHLRK